MNLKERIQELCKKAGISMNQLETELGFGKGYISKLGKSIPNAQKIQKIADYFSVSVDYLMTGKSDSENTELSAKDKKDIAKDLDILMGKLASGEEGPTRFNGQPIDEETLIFLRSAMEMSLTKLKQINKEKYNPNKNKK